MADQLTEERSIGSCAPINGNVDQEMIEELERRQDEGTEMEVQILRPTADIDRRVASRSAMRLNPGPDCIKMAVQKSNDMHAILRWQRHFRMNCEFPKN